MDVAVVGGGFTGLSAARALARRGAKVVVLEAGDRVAAEASGRNGGHVNNGLRVDYADGSRRASASSARAQWYHAYDEAVDTVERIVRDEGIDCDFLRRGKLKLATRPAHFDALRARSTGWRTTASTPTSRSSTRHGSATKWPASASIGGLLYKRSGQMHMGRFANGLAAAAERHGAQIHTPLRAALERLGGGQAHRVHTDARHRATRSRCCWPPARRGTAATRASAGCGGASCRSAASSSSPSRSGAERARALLRGRRTYVTIANIHNYFRLTADHRLVFGGRARFAVSNPQSDAKSGEILRRGLAEIFPQLARRAARLLLGRPGRHDPDRLPHAGERNGSSTRWATAATARRCRCRWASAWRGDGRRRAGQPLARP